MCWGAAGRGGVLGGCGVRTVGGAGGWRGCSRGTFLQGPPPVGAAAAVVSNTDHAVLFFNFFFFKRLLPAACGAERESGGVRAGFRRRGRRVAAAEGVWRSFVLFVFLAKVIPISVNPPAG